MPSVFFVDPTKRTIKPCTLAILDRIRTRVGQATHNIDISTETADGDLVEYEATVWPYEYTSYDDTFELACKTYRGTAVVVVHTDDKITADELPVAF